MAASPPKTSTAKARLSRLRIPDALPKLPDENSFPFARKRPELQYLSPGQLARIVVETPEWEEHVGVPCDMVDQQASAMTKSRRLYTSRELEFFEVLRVVLGLQSAEEARDWLGGDRASGTRKELDFDHPRDHVKDRYRPRQKEMNNDRRRDGVPSESTLRRHIRRMEPYALEEFYEAAFESIVPAALQESPELRAEARIQHTDGTGIRTHYTAPHYRKRSDGTSELINGHRVTAPDAGSTGNSKSADKNGDGWNCVNKQAVSGLCLSYAITLWHAPENKSAEHLVHEQYERLVAPYLQLEPGELCVESADGAFHRHEYRRKMREARIVQNIHFATHPSSDPSKRAPDPEPEPDEDDEDAELVGKGGKGKTKKKVAPIANYLKLNARRTPLDGTGWFVNGHFEPSCGCGEGVIERKFREVGGTARDWTEGRCKNCGPLSLTPGRWRKVKNPTRFVPVQHGEEGNEALGSPLTFNSKLSKYYGTARFAYQEGAHGVMENGYALLKHKRWFRTMAHARREAAMVFFIQHALARYQRREAARRAAASTAPPGATAGKGTATLRLVA